MNVYNKILIVISFHPEQLEFFLRLYWSTLMLNIYKLTNQILHIFFQIFLSHSHRCVTDLLVSTRIICDTIATSLDVSRICIISVVL